uniref:BTB and CNC homology 1, basic leucine zipper transcription factor 1 a n=1 Tax=Amphilophus citrinellus TaxID=61819 RepID=A0A3Q0R0N4_AMPCI
MTLQPSRTSVFTFQSAVHSAHVLQCLNEQRQHDVLCDVTVVVEDRCFRAHCSVLASCSKYFHTRLTSVTTQNPIITLPHEVTVQGFEPLLQFAYTSKLLFTKENIHAIHSSAEFLGFRNLESTCFDFLIPKFSESKKNSREVKQRACCQRRDPSVSFGPRVESSQPESFESHSSVPSGGDEQTDFSSQGPTNSREEHFCLDNCGPQMAPLSLELTGTGMCPMLALPCPHSDKAEDPSQFCERDILEMGDVCNQSEMSLADCSLSCELSTSGDANPPELIEPAGREIKQTVEMPDADTNCNPSSCPLEASGAEDSGTLLKQSEACFEQEMTGDLSDSNTLTPLSHEDKYGERSRVEREVAEHLAKGFWPDLCPSQVPPLPLDPVEQNNLARASDFHWLKQLDLTASVGDCPFLRDLGTDDAAAHTDSLSQAERSPYMSSSLNSADDSDLDTDGDTEANNKRAAEVQLPFPVKEISTVSRSAFQKLLKKYTLTQEQLDFVHDARRRSKNRVAAQRCRKRKLDSIHQLECEIEGLESEKERLLQEQTELKRNLEEMQQSICGLCKSAEFGSDQDQLKILARFSSPDFPISSPSLVPATEMVSSEFEQRGQTVRSVQIAEPQAGAADTSCPVPASLISACLDMNSSL